MKNLLFSAVLSFFFVPVFSQVQTPVVDANTIYGYKKLGTRTLVGEKRSYYGSEKRTPKGALSAKPTPADTIPMTVGDVYLVDSVALFWNFGPDGMAHLTELKATDKLYKFNGSTYARNCDNLIEPAVYLSKPAIGTTRPIYKDETNVVRQSNTVFVDDLTVVTSPNVIYVRPTITILRKVMVKYNSVGRQYASSTFRDYEGRPLELPFTDAQMQHLQVGVPDYWTPGATLVCYIPPPGVAGVE